MADLLQETRVSQDEFGTARSYDANDERYGVILLEAERESTTLENDGPLALENRTAKSRQT